MTIGERIRIRREELHMTQTELALKIGYKTKAAVCKIESGERLLPQTKIKPVADALQTTTEYIMGWEEQVPELDELQKKILSVYDKLSDDKKIALYEFIKSIAE